MLLPWWALACALQTPDTPDPGSAAAHAAEKIASLEQASLAVEKSALALAELVERVEAGALTLGEARPQLEALIRATQAEGAAAQRDLEAATKLLGSSR
jgi:exonuclease VII small subunit